MSSAEPIASADIATALLDGAPDGVVIVDEAASVIYANPLADSMFLAEPGTLIGRPISDLVPDRHRQVHGAHTTRFLANPALRKMGEIEDRLFGRRLDGSEFPVEISLSPIVFDEHDAVMASVRDISDRVEAERDQRAVQQSLDQVRDSVMLFDAESSQILHVNRGAVEQTGYTRETLLDGMTPGQFLPELLRRDLDEILESLRTGARSRVEIETSLRRRDGSDLAVELSIQIPPEAVLGGRQCFMALAHDVSERIADRDRLTASERSFRAAFEDAPVPMFLTDMSLLEARTIMSVNSAFEEFLGYSEAELVGREVNDLLAEDSRFEPIEYMEAAEHLVFHTEVPYVRKDGTIVWGSVAARTIDGDSTPKRLTHVTDISRRVAAESERDRREAQLALLAEIRKLVLVEEDTDVVLTFICNAGRALLRAAAVVILLPAGPDHLEIVTGSTMAGTKPDRALVPRHDPFVGSVLETGVRARSTTSPSAGDVGERIAEPLLASDDRIEGVLVAAPLPEQIAFGESDTALIAALALEAAVSLELDRVRSDRRRLLVVEDRERIARDLHDMVIQRLFAAGMSLQSAIGTSRLDERANDVINELDETIRSVRDTIFRLTTAPATVEDELKAVLDRYRSSTVSIGLRIEGDPQWISADRAEHLPPVVNELISNAVRHGGATTISVDLIVDRDHRMTIRVADDGGGLPADTNTGGLGLGNLTDRAYALNGTFHLTPGPVHGAVATWSVPLSP